MRWRVFLLLIVPGACETSRVYSGLDDDGLDIAAYEAIRDDDLAGADAVSRERSQPQPSALDPLAMRAHCC